MAWFERPLLVVGLGGNALNPPLGDPSYAAERAAVERTARALAALAQQRWRLLVVHGNGPQIGRLLPADGSTAELDIHVAQTQGELGYLLAQALQNACGQPTVALLTRVQVDAADAAFAKPSKPVGAVLPAPPAGLPATAVTGGWRRVVASPRPLAVLESEAITTLLRRQHVIAGGGGGVAVACSSHGCRGLAAVIDKDWVAARLAIELQAQALVFATCVPGVQSAHGTAQARTLAQLSVAQAQDLLAGGELGAGSMAPKVESAVAYAQACGRPALILHTDVLDQALRQSAPGTWISP
jgi:carbamate kinase